MIIAGVINYSVIDALLALQLFVVLFIGLHDWIPLGPLNDVKAVRNAVSPGKLFVSTVLSTPPFAIGFAASVYCARTGFPQWLLWLLWISYGLAIYGIVANVVDTLSADRRAGPRRSVPGDVRPDAHLSAGPQWD